MFRSHASRHARLAAAALSASALLSSCAGWVALDGRLAPPPGGGRLEGAVVWVDSLPPSAARQYAAAGRIAVLRERGNGWEPRVSAVAAGGTMRLENHDRLWHQGFGVAPGGRFEVAPAAPGATRTVRLPSPGVVGVWCALHGKPAAAVRVVPHGGFTRADRRGRFRLPPLPRGTYRVHAWHPEVGQVTRTVTIGGGRRDTLRLRLDASLTHGGIRLPRPAVAAKARRPTRGALRAAARAAEAGPRHEPKPTRDS